MMLNIIILLVIMLSVIMLLSKMLNVIMLIDIVHYNTFCKNADCRCALCNYAECHGAKTAVYLLRKRLCERAFNFVCRFAD
jgi:hypothetical protein